MERTRDFLLEIGSEELPSAPLMKAIAQLGRLFETGLDEAGLAHGEVRTLSTPRRLAVLVSDVVVETEAVHEVKRGPACAIAFDASGQPTKAASGFARGRGIDVSELVRRVDKDGKEYVFAEVEKPARPSAPILRDISERCIKGLDWPRSQRWGSEHERFGRPVRWICCLFGSEVIGVRFADVTASNTTRGHRVLGPGTHVVSDPAHYEEVLEGACVLGEERRRAAIREGIAAIERAEGGRVDTPGRTFDEVVNLCEWPTVLLGHFDEEFLAVPHEIICESMLSNQRYFPLYDEEGNLTCGFVVVSNADPACASVVAAGNERVVRARLDDAKFFYQEDLAHPMDSFVDRLDAVVFQEKLGTMRQKVARMEALAAETARAAGLGEDEASECVRAAHLAKADLVSSAVVEFTNQQGVMGGYYARAAGEPDGVCLAVREHYRPRFAGDELPSNGVGRVVAIADKLDTVCGIFAIDEPPTGSSDPYAVRRSAIGVINILRTMPSVDLEALVSCALGLLAEQGIRFEREQVLGSVCAFFSARLAAMAKDDGISPDTIEAVRAVGVIDPDEFFARAHALDQARTAEPELFDDLATAYARASHLADPALGDEVDESLLAPSEAALLSACESGRAEVASALASRSYGEAVKALARLREPIDRFFVDVLVMDEDRRLRDNRLRLLNRFARVFDGVADIGVLARKK
jgi:glycyl-tRNA synthetase beta chain